MTDVQFTQFLATLTRIAEALETVQKPSPVVGNQEPNQLERRYVHDCDKCVFLGQFGQYDLYFCEQAIGWPTVIARYSSDGPDYSSGLSSTSSPQLMEAKRRARLRGLLPPDA